MSGASRFGGNHRNTGNIKCHSSGYYDSGRATASSPPPPTFYVHAGARGAFAQTDAQATGGGLSVSQGIGLM
jgi:hypothetical protein